MELPLFQVDAFAREVFRGNPAAVVPLEAWLPDATLQAIALENHLSETAFLVPRGEAWELRWFTPVDEVDLCGHATLAAAHVIRTHLAPGAEVVEFRSPRSGALTVVAHGDRLELDFPSQARTPRAVDAELVSALGVAPREAFDSLYAMAVLEDEAAVRACAPDLRALERLARAWIVTAPGAECDFVSRFFAPGYGVPEDPVTGSAHCVMVPYWSARLGRASLFARQLSPRGGELWCEDRGPRTRIAGHAVDYLAGRIRVPG